MRIPGKVGIADCWSDWFSVAFGLKQPFDSIKSHLGVVGKQGFLLLRFQPGITHVEFCYSLFAISCADIIERVDKLYGITESVADSSAGD